MLHVAIVEDVESLRNDLHLQLSQAGYQVAAFKNGVALDKHLLSNPCHLVILDIGLPKENGLSIAKRLRHSRPDLRIVMLTGRGSEQDEADGLTQGADYYLVKPVVYKVLLAVIANQLRRASDSLAIENNLEQNQPWYFDVLRHQLITPDGIAIPVTSNQEKILRTLQISAPHPTSRENLIAAICRNGVAGDLHDEHKLDVNINRLRATIKSDTGIDDIIQTAHGKGYLFAGRLLLRNV